MNHVLTLAALLASSFTLAQTDKNPTVYINGTPIKGTVVTVGGKQFVQLSLPDLQKSGALVSGGSAPIKAIQGCMGQPLFNGVTRLTLLSAGLKDGKYVVSFKVANGTQKNLLPPSDADVNYDYMFAASADGQVQKFDTWDDANSPNRQLTPGANLTANFVLNTPPAFTVTRILFRPEDSTLKNGRLSELPFAPVSNMEFALKCK
ncbi:hypothetical protein Q0M94_08405 [Deinococcus radiomollis]|uniref:hypothetical protein n=1 Tax=Deinococcus radiomollis TaxID=468916 RepID=UPI0038920FB1